MHYQNDGCRLDIEAQIVRSFIEVDLEELYNDLIN